MLLSIDVHCCATVFIWGIQDLRFSMTITKRKQASVQFSGDGKMCQVAPQRRRQPWFREATNEETVRR